MVQGSESDYRLFPSFIASTRSVLNPRNNDLNSYGHAIAFALHPTDLNSRKVYSASNSRFIQHGLDKIKYPVLPNEIPGIEDKLHYRINLFSFDDAFIYKRYAKYISKRFYPEEINLRFFGRAICLDKAFLTTLCRYFKVFCSYYLTCYIFIIFIWLIYSRAEKKHFCTRYLKHFTEQRTLQQHGRYCKNEVEPGNLIDDLRNTGGYSQDIRKATLEKFDDTWKGSMLGKKVQPYKSYTP